MARTWLINSRWIARKVKNATQLPGNQVTEWSSEATRQCPKCCHQIDNSDVSSEWPGLPAGVKFDPTDIELLRHLAGKVGHGNAKSHLFIDEFIPTLESKDGICSTHPENLPGIKKDGSCVHFFHRVSNAYNVGCRKRRKIHMNGKQVRWHKTGKTKPVIENGVQKGFKKIMVLYTTSLKGKRPHKTNWVMHQFHLGTAEDETDGQFVVSKIFYQHHGKNSDRNSVVESVEEMDIKPSAASPGTPNMFTPNPSRLQNPDLCHAGDREEVQCLPLALVGETSNPQNAGEGLENWMASESKDICDRADAVLGNSLFCDEILEAFPCVELGLDQAISLTEFGGIKSYPQELLAGTSIPDFCDIYLGTPPDLADLQFGSQESIMSWLDRV